MEYEWNVSVRCVECEREVHEGCGEGGGGSPASGSWQQGATMLSAVW